jgi:hypothetical protein
MKPVSKFTTKAELAIYIQKIIKSVGVCDSVKAKSPAVYRWFMEELFIRHPNFHAKTKDVVDIFITHNAFHDQYLQLNLKKVTGTCDDISWRCCVTGKAKNLLKVAMRVAISPQIRAFKNSQRQICALCHRTDAKEFHVDHVRHFEELYTLFLSTEQAQSIPTNFKRQPFALCEFLVEDMAFQLRWVKFHAEMADLRVLCQSCNLHRSHWKA